MFNCCFVWFVCLITGCVGRNDLGAVLMVALCVSGCLLCWVWLLLLGFAMVVCFVSLIIGMVCFSGKFGL